MNNFGVRRGAWTVEEDRLLKECIGKYGAGKWHQVPTRSGLNRCRKSCRLRWLNYLQPNIKRGTFGDDEVDLIFKLHKLLGNRWSLIAGRLPGRTANDVKNYWNTHLKKKVQNIRNDNNCHNKSDQECKVKQSDNIFKPKVCSFSKKSLASLHKQLSVKLNDFNRDEGKYGNGNKDEINKMDYYSSNLSFEFCEEQYSIRSWWEDCCFIEENAAILECDHKLESCMPPLATTMESVEENWPDLGLWGF